MLGIGSTTTTDATTKKNIKLSSSTEESIQTQLIRSRLKLWMRETKLLSGIKPQFVRLFLSASESENKRWQHGL
jgi:hypothetical protein